jgi:uncharacterized protein YegL
MTTSTKELLELATWVTDTSLTKGDYVLATKYKDGDPKDEWAIGFYSGMLDARFMVVNAQGQNIRGNGFRRVKKITARRGQWLLDNRQNISMGNRRLWSWLRQSMKSGGTSNE